MEKFQSLSFYDDKMKYITMVINGKRKDLLNHGEISFEDDSIRKNPLQWSKKYPELFKKQRFNRNKGYITIESNHTYLNMKSIKSLEPLNHKELIQNNYQHMLPILFEKNCYGFDYNVDCINIPKTTEIAFMAMLQNKIDDLFQLSRHLNVNLLALNPSYQYFADLLKIISIQKEIKNYVLYIESNNKIINIVLIHHKNPIMKRSIVIDSRLEIEINNYFYYLKNYLLIADISIFFRSIDSGIESIIIQCIKPYFQPYHEKISDILQGLLCFKEITKEVMINYEDCFIALGGMGFNEFTKRKNQ